jgi:hypothetical protein
VRQLIKTILREQVQTIESSDEKLEKLIGQYISSSYPKFKKYRMYPKGGNVGITTLTLPNPVDERDNLIFKMDAYGTPDYQINPDFLNSVKSMFGGDKKIKKLIFKWFDKKEVDQDLLGNDLGKQEDNEGSGAYDAPAFEMEPDHTTFKHEQKEAELTERCWKGYTQKGMKTMFGKRYPNCVKKK